MIIQGKSGDAFQRFYAEDVVAQENDEPERISRDSWMRGRQEMEKKILMPALATLSGTRLSGIPPTGKLLEATLP